MHCNRNFIFKKKDPLHGTVDQLPQKGATESSFYSMDVFVADQLVCKLLGFF